MTCSPKRWHARLAVVASICATLALIRSWPAVSGAGDQGARRAVAATTTAGAASQGQPRPPPPDAQATLRAALCKPCPTRAVTDPDEPERASKQDADYPTIWVQSTLGTGRTGNIIKRLHRAITHAHACKALLFLPEHDNWESFYPPPASRVIDFRNRAGGRHPRCSTAETKDLNILKMSLESNAGGEAEADPEASNWRLSTQMTYWSWAQWRTAPPAGWDDEAGSARGRIIWFAAADMRAAGLATDREAMYAWRNATEDLTTTCLRHYLGFCEPGFCDGAAGTGADASVGATATVTDAATEVAVVTEVAAAGTTPAVAAAAATGPSPAVSIRRGGRAMRSAMADHVTRTPPLPPTAGPYLAVHIRQGDIYPPNFGETPWKGNGQPPLAYYLSALSHQAWGRVDILAELGVPEGPVMASLRLLRSFGALPGNLGAPGVDAHGLAGPAHITQGRAQGLPTEEPESPARAGAGPARAELVFPEERPLGLAVAAADVSMDAQIAAANARSNEITAESAAAWRADIQKMVCADAVVTALSSTASIAGLGFAQAIYSPQCDVSHAASGRVWMVEWDLTDGTVLSPDGKHRSGIWRPPFQQVHNNSAAEWAGLLLTPAAAPVSCERTAEVPHGAGT